MLYPINELNSEYFYDIDFNYSEKSNVFYIFDALKYVDKQLFSQCCRPILTQHWNKKDFILNYLFWYEKMDLKSLDEKVISSTYNNMDFFHSIKCDFLPHFSCLNCGYKYENILIVDAIPIYPNNFNLAKEKINYIKNNHKNLKCENCNKYFNRLILHIFHSLSSKK